MIILDYSQTIISNLMAEIGGRKDVELDINLLRHMVLNTIRSHKLKFQGDYGELVIACDNKKYWRKEIFPYYKGNRKRARDESGYNWKLIFDSINQIKDEIINFFPYRVLEVQSAEADDIIATLCKWTQDNYVEEGKIFSEPKPVLIISGDHDFIQLQKYKNVKQYSPILKKFIKTDIIPEKYVLEHIIKGDRGDGIPNVLSQDDAIVSGERQRPISSKKLKEWVETPSSMPQDTTFKRNYDRNKSLIDLTQIPELLEKEIINTFNNYKVKDRSLILPFFIENKMKHLMEHLEEF